MTSSLFWLNLISVFLLGLNLPVDIRVLEPFFVLFCKISDDFGVNEFNFRGLNVIVMMFFLGDLLKGV
jgi:hypothetical protein